MKPKVHKFTLIDSKKKSNLLINYRELTEGMLIERILNINTLSYPVYRGTYRCKSIVYIAVHF